MGSISKLIDSCNQSSLVLRVASERSGNDNFRAFADKTRLMLERFSYELQTEIRRIAGPELESPRSYSEQAENPDLQIPRCITSLQAALEEYVSAFTSPLPAHSRAMLKRQQLQIKEAFEQLVQLRRVAVAKRPGC